MPQKCQDFAKQMSFDSKGSLQVAFPHCLQVVVLFPQLSSWHPAMGGASSFFHCWGVVFIGPNPVSTIDIC